MEDIEDVLRRIAVSLLTRPPDRRGPWVIRDAELRRLIVNSIK